MSYIKLKKIDFVIVVLIITATILLLDNLYFQDTIFSIDDLHHEAYVIALALGALLLFFVRKRLI